MDASTYYGVVAGVTSGLQSKIAAVTWLSGKVDIDVWKTSNKSGDFPRVVITLDNDAPVLENLKTGTYQLNPTFNVVFQTLLSGQGAVVSGVGAVFDKIREASSNYSGGDSGWEKARVTKIDYGYASPGMAQVLLHEAMLTVTVTREY